MSAVAELQGKPENQGVGDTEWKPPKVVIWPASQKQKVQVQAAEVAASLGLEQIADPQHADDMMLVVTAGGLELRDCATRGMGPVRVDFARWGRCFHRYSNTLFRQPFGKSIGMRAGRGPLVWDATAGLGQDTCYLACMGCRVVAIERSPILGAMLQDGLARAAREEDMQCAAEGVCVIVGDARGLLDSVPREEAPDVVYLDPMFAPRKKKSALAKKEMRVLRRLVGPDPDAGELLEAAMRAAGRRVVVKRHRHAKSLGPRPDAQYHGKIARYDVYFTRNVVIPSDLDYGEEDEFELGEAYDDPCATDRTSDSDNDDCSDEPIPY